MIGCKSPSIVFFFFWYENPYAKFSSGFEGLDENAPTWSNDHKPFWGKE